MLHPEQRPSNGAGTSQAAATQAIVVTQATASQTPVNATPPVAAPPRPRRDSTRSRDNNGNLTQPTQVASSSAGVTRKRTYKHIGGTQ